MADHTPPMRFIVRYDHELGPAKSYSLSASEALKLATDWVNDGESGVMVENPETGEVWTPEQFRAVV